jgi:DNA-binding response OmpR family regulator
VNQSLIASGGAPEISGALTFAYKSRGSFDRLPERVDSRLENLRVAKVLLVEDNIDLANSLRKYLLSRNYTVDHAATAAEGDYLARNYLYELVILDWELPDGSGASLCAGWRAAQLGFPVLMLTGRSTVPDKVHGLDQGADDYLSKPFDREELEARLRALLKRVPAQSNSKLEFADLQIDLSSRRVSTRGVDLKLIPRDFDVLAFLAQNPAKAFSTDQILLRVWGDTVSAQPTAVFSAVKRLRKVLSEAHSVACIEHQVNSGYGLFESSGQKNEDVTSGSV